MDKTVSYPLVFKRIIDFFVSVFFRKDGHTIDFSTSREYSTTCCIVASLHNSVCCCFALLRFITTRRHEISCGVLFSFKAFSTKQQKKAKEKINQYSVIEHNALSDNYMENIIKCSYPKMTGQNDRRDESLTGQVHDRARHCPLTGRYFEPWLIPVSSLV